LIKSKKLAGIADLRSLQIGKNIFCLATFIVTMVIKNFNLFRLAAGVSPSGIKKIKNPA